MRLAREVNTFAILGPEATVARRDRAVSPAAYS